MYYEKRSLRITATVQEIPYRRKDWTPNTTILGVRVIFWKLACNRAHGAKVQIRYHKRLMTNALLQNGIVPDTTAGIVTKLK
jgi:hypothetical protein